jgi:hypothetical protein
MKRQKLPGKYSQKAAWRKYGVFWVTFRLTAEDTDPRT